MKCEHCGKNEVTFIYQSNLNGHVEEKRLCGECAERLGYSEKLAKSSRRMMQNFFGGSLLDDFFAPVPSLMGRSLFPMEDIFDDFFAEMPALRAAAPRQEQPAEQQELVEKEEQSRFSRMRRLNALRMEMKKAVRHEEFERAAQLRDEIRALEKEDVSGEESA